MPYSFAMYNIVFWRKWLQILYKYTLTVLFQLCKTFAKYGVTALVKYNLSLTSYSDYFLQNNKQVVLSWYKQENFSLLEDVIYLNFQVVELSDFL